MKKLSKTISLMLAFVMVLSLQNLLLVNVQALEIGSEESLGAVNACADHTLGTFSGVPACVNGNGDLHICENNFPDENFRDYVLKLTGGQDGYFTETEGKNISRIYCPVSEIVSLKGVEFFTELTFLSCHNNQLTELDISKNIALTYLDCHSNRLAKIDISKNTALITLDCDYNQLTELDVSKNTALASLSCYLNKLTELDVSNNINLRSLNCASNRLNEGLNVSGCIKLEILECGANQLTELNVNSCISLQRLDCKNTQIKELNISGHPSIVTLNCNNQRGGLEKLDVSNCTALKNINCGAESSIGCTLVELNVNNCTSLERLRCYYSLLKNLDVTTCTALKSLYCYNNNLTELDVRKNTALTDLHCHSNQLTELDVSKNTALTSLSCNSNQLTELDVSKNTALTYSSCNGQNAALTLYEKNGKWIADLNTIVSPSNFERIISFNRGTFDLETGLITFESKPSSFTYTYDVGKDDKTMNVNVDLTDHAHAFSDWQVRTPATCTEKGEEYRTCACGEEETREITALGHSFTSYVSDNNATCTENGTETAKCDRCDATDTRTIENSALGHDYSEEWTIDKEATCTQPGSKSHHCTRCRDKADITEIPAAGHSFGEWFVEKPASMTEDGLEVRICSVCKEREEKILPAGEYLPGDVDNNGKVDDKDATYLLMHIFYPEDYPVRQDCDFNHDGEITDEDASYLLYYTFFPDDYPLIKQ